MKEGDTISKTKMVKLLTGKTQNMWDEEAKCFKGITLTTRYDGEEATIDTLKNSSNYQVIRAISETQEIKLIYNLKKKELMSGSILPVGWRNDD
jgi:hypothetical protein